MKRFAVLLILVLMGIGCAKKEAEIPSPVFDAKPEYVDLYWTAWEQAKDHIKY